MPASGRVVTAEATASTVFDPVQPAQPLIVAPDGATMVRPRPRALAGAMSAWFLLIFAVCYVAIPAALGAAGASDGMLINLLFNAPAFVLAGFVTILSATALRWRVRIGGPTDPVVPAALGGLAAWALIHNTTPFLTSFTDFGLIEFVGFFGLNVVEMGMLGMMLASFTSSRIKAFALGASFQFLFLGMVLGLIGVLF
jgi:hypothetical protein